MIASPLLPSCRSQFVATRIVARRLSPRAPSLVPRCVAAAYSSAQATDLPSRELTPPTTSLYEILGVATKATPQEIKSAYRYLARTCHPDTLASGNGGASADEFMRIHTAYATLSDPKARADYNRKLMVIHHERRPVTYSAGKTVPFAGGYARRRTWETDQCW